MVSEKIKTIYISDLGYRDPIADKEILLWYFQNIAKTKSKGEATKYWLDLMEQYGETLLSLQAFEVYILIKSNATDAKMKRREESRKKTKENSEKEIAAFLKQHEERKAILELIYLVRYN